nr:Chain C, epitope of PB1-F2 [Influenza A virus]
LSLRNPILV